MSSQKESKLVQITQFKDSWQDMKDIPPVSKELGPNYQDYVIVRALDDDIPIPANSPWFDHWHGCQDGMWLTDACFRQNSKTPQIPRTSRTTFKDTIYAVPKTWYDSYLNSL